MASNLSAIADSIAPYVDRRCLTVFGFGIASGFPWVLIGSMLSLWLKEEGLSRSAIGYAGAIFAAYSINFLWSPLIDRLKLPVLGKLGQRRSYIVAGNSLIALLCVGIGVTQMQFSAEPLIILCLLIAIVSASQDIAIDAYRIDIFHAHERQHIAAAAAMSTAGWWTGYAGIGYFPLLLSDTTALAWPQLYLILGAVPLTLAVVALLQPEPIPTARTETQQHAFNQYIAQLGHTRRLHKSGVVVSLALILSFIIWAVSGFTGAPNSQYWGAMASLTGLLLLANVFWQLTSLSRQSAGVTSTTTTTPLDSALAWLLVTLVEPIKNFFSDKSHRVAIGFLLFIFLFKIGEAFLGRMSVVFYKEIGFTNADIGFYSKLLSWWVTIGFSLIGGWFTLHKGIYRGLLAGGIAMAASNLLFAALALLGALKPLFALTILVDGFTTAWSTVAFVAFISLLCNRGFTATQYALLASLGTLGRTLLASNSGVLVDTLAGNWTVFFVITAVMVIPSLIILTALKPHIYALQDNATRE